MFGNSNNIENYQHSPRTSYAMETRECSPVKLRDASLYDDHDSPSRMSCDGSPQNCSFTLRRPSFDHFQDTNTQDSGYFPGSQHSNKVSPIRKHLSFEDYIDLSDIENDTPISPERKLPGDFSKLITATIAPTALPSNSPKCTYTRPPLRRPFSIIGNGNISQEITRAKTCLFDTINSESRSFKRPEPPTEMSSPIIKKYKFTDRPVRRIAARPIFQRSISNQETIKTALHRSSTEPDLIGDFTKTFSLPLIAGRHDDLKSITPATVAKLIRGEFEDTIASFKIIDCRYPYEYEGGHIEGAHNMYTKDQITKELLNIRNKNSEMVQDENKRHILIFHCEFSSERAPNLSRFLRNSDRKENKDYYPFLNFPEVYLLDGGYKNFYETHVELCAPQGYLPMLHPDYEQSLKHFRAKSRTFNADLKTKHRV